MEEESFGLKVVISGFAIILFCFCVSFQTNAGIHTPYLIVLFCLIGPYIGLIAIIAGLFFIKD